MSKVYLMDQNAQTSELVRVRCKDEDRELQRLLESNPRLLSGEQMDPNNPREWLLIKREMPVPDPSSGAPRWSIDFFYVDQFAIPTLVECKRCDDTRSRREVIAQMLEYAANGHHYWKSSEMRSYAEATAGGSDALAAVLPVFAQTDDRTVDGFFTLVEQNLREAKMRLVFFLEESPNELRSLVDFLNRQMTNTEVFLVEARQYQYASERVVVPWLFGYTEESRVVKRETRKEASASSGERGVEAYWREVEQYISSPETQSAMRKFLSGFETQPLSDWGVIWWGKNALIGLPKLVKSRAICILNRNGRLGLCFDYWNERYTDVGQRQLAARDDFAMGLQSLGIQLKQDWKTPCSPSLTPDEWMPRVDEILALLARIGEQYADTNWQRD